MVVAIILHPSLSDINCIEAHGYFGSWGGGGGGGGAGGEKREAPLYAPLKIFLKNVYLLSPLLRLLRILCRRTQTNIANRT